MRTHSDHRVTCHSALPPAQAHGQRGPLVGRRQQEGQVGAPRKHESKTVAAPVFDGDRVSAWEAENVPGKMALTVTHPRAWTCCP